MFCSIPSTIRTGCVVMYLLLGIVPESIQYTCDRPKMHLVMVEVQMSDDSVFYCMGMWICSIVNTYIEDYKIRNSSCGHVLTSANCLKRDDSHTIRVYFNTNPEDIEHEKLNDLSSTDIRSVEYHPDYDSITHVGDIVLIKVEKRQTYDDDANDMTWSSLQLIKKFIKNSNYPSYKMKTGIFTWIPNLEKTNFKFNEDNYAYFEDDFVHCPSPKSSSTPYEEKFWFMFICLKQKTSEPTIGSMLIMCSKNSADALSSSIQIIGFYTDSFLINNIRVTRYTFLYWYKPWIFYMMDLDNIHDLYDQTVPTMENYTDIPGYESITEYYGDSSYDHIIMGPNPWNNAVSSERCFIFHTYIVVWCLQLDVCTLL